MKKEQLLRGIISYCRRLETASCVLCGATVIPDTTVPGLCGACIHEIRSVPGPFTLEDLPRVTAACAYGGEMKRAMEMLKISGRRDVAVALSRLLLRPLFEALLEEWNCELTDDSISDLALVPVPGSLKGRRRRGFDQSILLARELSPRVRPVIARRGGQAQKSLNREERLQNAHQQYHISNFARRHWRDGHIPARVLIVDDIVTTGASILRCAELVTALGVQDWRALTVAARL